MPIIIVIIFISLFLHSKPIVSNIIICNIGEKPQRFIINTDTNAVVTYSIVNALDNTFGYEIFYNGKKIIRQLSVPGVSGNKGFKSKKSAEKVAQIVIDKIKNGKTLPSITLDDLKKINIVPE